MGACLPNNDHIALPTLMGSLPLNRYKDKRAGLMMLDGMFSQFGDNHWPRKKQHAPD